MLNPTPSDRAGGEGSVPNPPSARGSQFRVAKPPQLAAQSPGSRKVASAPDSRQPRTPFGCVRKPPFRPAELRAGLPRRASPRVPPPFFHNYRRHWHPKTPPGPRALAPCRRSERSSPATPRATSARLSPPAATPPTCRSPEQACGRRRPAATAAPPLRRPTLICTSRKSARLRRSGTARSSPACSKARLSFSPPLETALRLLIGSFGIPTSPLPHLSHHTLANRRPRPPPHQRGEPRHEPHGPPRGCDRRPRAGREPAAALGGVAQHRPPGAGAAAALRGRSGERPDRHGAAAERRQARAICTRF